MDFLFRKGEINRAVEEFQIERKAVLTNTHSYVHWIEYLKRTLRRNCSISGLYHYAFQNEIGLIYGFTDEEILTIKGLLDISFRVIIIQSILPHVKTRLSKWEDLQGSSISSYELFQQLQSWYREATLEDIIHVRVLQNVAEPLTSRKDLESRLLDELFVKRSTSICGTYYISLFPPELRSQMIAELKDTFENHPDRFNLDEVRLRTWSITSPYLDSLPLTDPPINSNAKAAGPKQKKKKVTCQFCKKRGHQLRQCYFLTQKAPPTQHAATALSLW